MRRIILMRHAKAEGHGAKPDFERTLEPRGITDAARVGEAMVVAGFVPDRILCSAARRTRDTLSAILPVLRGACTVELRPDLYDAGTRELRDAVRRADGQCVLLIGHNPSVHTLALAFAAGAAEAAPIASSYPTSTAAVFTRGFGLDTVQFETILAP